MRKTGRDVAPQITVPSDPFVLGYLAGLVDGEGCIRISSSFDRHHSKNLSYAISVTIANTNDLLMVWLLESVGGAVCTSKHGRGRKANWKPGHEWKLGGKNAERFLIAIGPYLVIKREQAEVALRLRDLQKRTNTKLGDPVIAAAKATLKAEMHRLNAKGVVVDSAMTIN